MAGTIAVVDDDEDVREVLELLLETAGHTVRLYSTGSSLLSDNDLDQVDCVIIDQNMPGLSGTDVLLEINRRRLASQAARKGWLPARSRMASSRRYSHSASLSSR